MDLSGSLIFGEKLSIDLANNIQNVGNWSKNLSSSQAGLPDGLGEFTKQGRRVMFQATTSESSLLLIDELWNQ